MQGVEGLSIQDMIDSFMATDGGQPEVEATGIDKNASANVPVAEMTDDEVQTKLAQADFLDWLADVIEHPESALALAKTAAKGTSKGKGGAPGAPDPAGTHVQVTEASGDKYNFVTGQATHQPKNPGLQRGEAGAAGTHVAVSEAGPDTPLQAPLSKLSARDDVMNFVLNKLGAIDGGTYEGSPNITGQEMKPPEGLMDATQPLKGMRMDDGSSQVAGMLATNESAANYTIRQARQQSIIDLKKMLNEKAQRRATDKDLSSNFVNTERAGVKIASGSGPVRAALAHVVATRGSH